MTNPKYYFALLLVVLIELIRFSDAELDCDCQPNVDDRIVGGTRTGRVTYRK